MAGKYGPERGRRRVDNRNYICETSVDTSRRVDKRNYICETSVDTTWITHFFEMSNVSFLCLRREPTFNKHC